MKILMSDIFLTYQPSFKGNETILLLCDNQTIAWLIQQFEQFDGFVLGDGKPVGSDGRCIVIAEPHGEVTCSRIAQERTNYFRWVISPDSANRYRSLLLAMLETDKPCHQYLDADDNISPVVMISRGEYEIEAFKTQGQV